MPGGLVVKDSAVVAAVIQVLFLAWEILHATGAAKKIFFLFFFFNVQRLYYSLSFPKMKPVYTSHFQAYFPLYSGTILLDSIGLKNLPSL